MLGLLTIAIGTLFIAFAWGVFPMDEQPPAIFRIIFGLMGALAVYGGLHTIRFRIRQRQAFSGGRERDGTLTLRVSSGDEDPTAFAIFSTSRDEWLVTVDPALFIDAEGSSRETIRARAYLDEDDVVYGLKAAGKRIKLSGPGHPFKGRMRSLVERAEKRFKAMAENHRSDDNNPQNV